MRIINVTPKMDALLLGKQGENKSTKFLFDVSGWLEDYPGCSIGLNYRPAKSNVSYPCILMDENNGKKSWLITSSELVNDGDGLAELVCIQDEVVEKDKRTWKTKVMKSLGGSGTAPDPWENWEDTFIELAERAEDAAEDAEDNAEDAEAYAVGTRGGTDVSSDDPAYHNNSKYYSEEAGSSASAAAGSATTAGNKAQDAEAYGVGKRGGVDVKSTDPAYHNNAKYFSEQASGSATAAAGSATAAAASAAQAGSKANRAAIAKEYADLTFPVTKGTWCWQEGVLYEANQAISTSETWTAAHWTAVTVEGACGSLKTEIANKADIIISSASGSIASFSDGVENLPLEDCVVQITPVQDTSGGDPSPTNICPISGWAGCNLTVANGDDNTAEDYHATVYPITWQTEAGTVYGGYVNPVTGVLTVTHAIEDLGNLTWTYDSQTADHERFYTGSLYGSAVGAASTDVADMMCTALKVVSNNDTYAHTYDNSISMGATGNIYAYASTYNGDSTAFTNGMDGVNLVYKLATPITYQLDHITIRTLLGENHIFADTGDVSVQYRADTKKYVDGFYKEPSGGIPSSDMASAVQTSLGKADTAYQKPVGGIPLTDLADNTETVSGTTPSITGVAGHRYICGECATLTITAPASGCIDVVFESGSTPTVLTVTSAKTGVSAIKWANGFDPSSLEANTTYELNILDGEYGVVGKWT